MELTFAIASRQPWGGPNPSTENLQFKNDMILQLQVGVFHAVGAIAVRIYLSHEVGSLYPGKDRSVETLHF